MKRTFNNVSSNIIKKIFGYIGNKEYAAGVLVCKNMRNTLYINIDYALKSCEIMFRTAINLQILVEQKDEKQNKMSDIKINIATDNTCVWNYTFAVTFVSHIRYLVRQEIYDKLTEIDSEAVWIDDGSDGCSDKGYIGKYVIDKYKSILQYNKHVIKILSDHEYVINYIPLYIYKFINSTIIENYETDTSHCNNEFDYPKYFDEFMHFVMSDERCFDRLSRCFEDTRQMTIFLLNKKKKIMNNKEKQKYPLYQSGKMFI
jgi:hypothetical protein